MAAFGSVCVLSNVWTDLHFRPNDFRVCELQTREGKSDFQRQVVKDTFNICHDK